MDPDGPACGLGDKMMVREKNAGNPNKNLHLLGSGPKMGLRFVDNKNARLESTKTYHAVDNNLLYKICRFFVNFP